MHPKWYTVGVMCNTVSMNEEQAKILKAASWVVIALASLAYVYHYAQSIDNTYPTRTFSVDGSAEVDTVPDVALFSATVMTEGGKNVAEVQQANSEKMNQVNAFVREQGVKEKDLKTNQYTLSPRYNYPTCVAGVCPPATIVGYTLTQTLEVKVREVETLGDLLAGVVNQGANSVSEVRFVLDDDTDAKNEAREEALAKAKAKAKATAMAAGFRLGELVSLYESTDPALPYGMGGDMMELSAKANVAPAVEPGTQTTRVTVNLTYAIE